jgi:hypothetical protein
MELINYELKLREMKKLLLYFILPVFTVLFFSCEDKRETLDFSSDVDIHSFSINGVEGIINAENSTVTLILPNGTDLTALSPQITIAGEATVMPESGETIDFSNSAIKGGEVVYTVTNGNLYQKYKVSIDVARAKITAFRIGTVAATIDDVAKTVTIYLPVGTDVTALIPIMEYTDGATITPTDGTPVDFTNPVEYRLNYLGSEFIYTVTVHLGDPPLPPIVIYNGEDICPQWSPLACSGLDSKFDNPKKDGINASLFCASMVRSQEDIDPDGKPWTGGALWNNVSIDPALYGSFSMKVLKNVAGDIQLEIQSAGEQNKDWLKVWYAEEQLGEWQELVFQIPAGRTAIINNILVAPHCHEAGQPVPFVTQRMYWDNLIAIPK